MGNLSNIGIQQDIDPQNMDSDPVPDGKYLAQLIDSGVTATKNGKGSYLAATFELLAEGVAGKRVFTNFNLENENEKAVQIGLGMLSSFARACGRPAIPDDSGDLHEIPVLLKIKYVAAERDLKTGKMYEPKNEVKAFYPANNGASIQAVTPGRRGTSVLQRAVAVEGGSPISEAITEDGDIPF